MLDWQLRCFSKTMKSFSVARLFWRRPKPAKAIEEDRYDYWVHTSDKDSISAAEDTLREGLAQRFITSDGEYFTVLIEILTDSQYLKKLYKDNQQIFEHLDAQKGSKVNKLKILPFVLTVPSSAYQFRMLLEILCMISKNGNSIFNYEMKLGDCAQICKLLNFFEIRSVLALMSDNMCNLLEEAATNEELFRQRLSEVTRTFHENRLFVREQFVKLQFSNRELDEANIDLRTQLEKNSLDYANALAERDLLITSLKEELYSLQHSKSEREKAHIEHLKADISALRQELDNNCTVQEHALFQNLQHTTINKQAFVANSASDETQELINDLLKTIDCLRCSVASHDLEITQLRASLEAKNREANSICAMARTIEQQKQEEINALRLKAKSLEAANNHLQSNFAYLRQLVVNSEECVHGCSRVSGNYSDIQVTPSFKEDYDDVKMLI